MAGKGDRPRPGVYSQEYRDNFDNIFGARRRKKRMDCYNCGEELIPGGDHEMDERHSNFLMETNLSCPGCGTEVSVYTPRGTLHGGVDKDAKDDKNV